VRLLRRRFGDIEARIVAKIQELSREQLEKLGEALLDFYDVSDLDPWLGFLVHK